MINPSIIAVKGWGGMDELAQKDEISAFLIPVDPLTRWLVRRKQFSPWLAALVTLLVLYLPIAVAVSIRGLWYSFNFYLMNSHLIGLLGDEIWLSFNLFLALPTVFLFFQLPNWLDSLLHQSAQRMAARGIPAGELLDFLRGSTRTNPGWIVSLFFALIPGWLLERYNNYCIDYCTHWFRMIHFESYLVVFWTLIVAMLFLNIARVWQWKALLKAMQEKFGKG